MVVGSQAEVAEGSRRERGDEDLRSSYLPMADGRRRSLSSSLRHCVNAFVVCLDTSFELETGAIEVHYL